MSNNDFFTETFKFHKELKGSEFIRSVLKTLENKQKQRRSIIILFSVLGILATLTSLLVLTPSDGLPSLLSPISTLSMASVILFVLWIMLDEFELSS